MFNLRVLTIGVLILALGVLVAGTALTRWSGSPSTAAGAEEKPLSGIVVGGEGIVYAEPDMATVYLGVQTTAPTAQEAQQRNAQLMGKVVDHLLGLKIDRKDIRTSNISIYPVYEGRNGRPSTPSGYQASNQVSVTVRDLARVSAVLDGAVAAGANVAGGVSFGFQDDSHLRREALAAAVENAKGKAETIAKAAGVRITGVRSVVEEGLVVPRPLIEGRALPATEPQPSTPVMPGQLTVVGRVQVTFSTA